jgi:hypothetical protein
VSSEKPRNGSTSPGRPGYGGGYGYSGGGGNGSATLGLGQQAAFRPATPNSRYVNDCETGQRGWRELRLEEVAREMGD